MTDFSTIWKFINRNGSIVQVREELEYVYNLAKGCSSYLEIGTAEGSSLYAMANALDTNSKIAFVDWCEEHTTKMRDEALKILTKFHTIVKIKGDTHSHESINKAAKLGPFDIVMIDAGHIYPDVVADAIAYGGLATKYIIFHDMKLPEVKLAFEWYCKTQKFDDVHMFIMPDSPYGYGIVKL